MNYVGIDIHKRYSVLCALDDKGVPNIVNFYRMEFTILGTDTF